MSAIVLFHVGDKLPQHLRDCIAKARQFSADIPIYVISNHRDTSEALWIDVNSMVFDRVRSRLEAWTYFNGEEDCLWRTSCHRLFFIHRLMGHCGLTDVLHFDNDVMLFERPEKIAEIASRCFSSCAVTPHNGAEVTFGMGYFKDADHLAEMNDAVEREILSLGWQRLTAKYGTHPSEMMLVSAVAPVEFFPVLPFGWLDQRYMKHYADFGAVFDPSSYGQFLAGTDGEKRPGWFGNHHEIGRLIGLKRVQPMMDGNRPVAVCDGHPITISSLHVHSKNTGQFL